MLRKRETASLVLRPPLFPRNSGSLSSSTPIITEMTTLKSALRFPTSHSSPHPPPPPIPVSPPKQHNLTSRFSAETLIVKSPPGAKTIQRFFSAATSHSPPSSPSFRRSQSFSASTSTPRPKHSPSASESRINVSSPRHYESDIEPWSRTSLDEAEVLRSPTVGKVPGRGRDMSGASSGGAIGAGRDKLAGAAKEMMELLARKKSGHGRKGSDHSHRSSTSGRSRESRSLSSPTRPSIDLVPTKPSKPKRQVPDKPRSSEESERSAKPNHKIFDLPPRSDSRNACTNTTLSPPPLRPPPAPPVSSTGSPSKASKPTLRPNSPPSISIPPLHPRSRPLVIAAVAAKTDESFPPFKAMILSAPSREQLVAQEPGEVILEISVGGSPHTTTVETLAKYGGGKLAEYIDSALGDIRRSAPQYARNTLENKRPDFLKLPSSNHDEGDESGSNFSISPSRFEVSPHPSPFPFMRYSSSKSDIDFDNLELGPEDNDCSSPIDPLAPQLFLPMSSFMPPPPPLRLELDRLPASKQVKVVASPRLDAKHLSVHPSIFTTSPPPPQSPSPDPPTPRRTLTAPSPRSMSFHNLPPSPNEIAARKALAKRLHLSTGTFMSDQEDGSDDMNPFEAALEPFFEVIRHQAYSSIPSPSSATSGSSSSTTTHAKERNSLALPEVEMPMDAGYTTPEEDRSRSTMLGIPRGSVKRARRAKEQPPLVPEVKVEFGEKIADSRPPSLTKSDSTLRTESDYSTSLAPFSSPPRLCIFLDRIDTTLPSGLGSTYSTVLSFLQDGQLPPFLTLPTSDPSHPVDPTSLSILTLQPSLAFAQIAALRTIEREARWLSLDALLRTCEMERGRWIEAVKMVEYESRKKKVEEQRKQEGGEVRRKRMKERQLEGWI